MAKMLVSGGNGFLGSHLVDKALKSGIEVTVVDDLSTSKTAQIPKETKFVKSEIERYEPEENYDFVVHLAARPSPEDYIKNPVKALASNSLGTFRMLEIARKSKAVFMYTSSSEIYGNAWLIPTPEEYFGYVNPNGIRSCYDEGKRFSEALIMSYNREHKLDTRIQRPFNVYGPGMRADGQYGRVIPRFIEQALSGSDITVHGSGQQTRSFLYVDDWLEACWKLLMTKGLSGAVLNIGMDQEISIIDLAILIKNLTKSGSKIVNAGEREEDPQRRAADITRARKLLKWSYKTPLEEGLKSTISWFSRHA